MKHTFVAAMALSLLLPLEVLAAMSDAKAISEAVRLFGPMGGIQTQRAQGATYWTKSVGVYSPECQEPFTTLGSGLNTWEAAFAAVRPDVIKRTVSGDVQLKANLWDNTGVKKFQWVLDGRPLGAAIEFSEPYPVSAEVGALFQTTTVAKGTHVLCGYATRAVGDVERLPAFVFNVDQAVVAVGVVDLGDFYPSPRLTLSTDESSTVIVAFSCARDDVAAAIDVAASGDLVLIPEGTCAWGASLKIVKGITLRGAGIGRTIILDAIPATGVLLSWVCEPGTASRLTGIEFRNGGRAEIDFVGRIRIGCTNIAGTTFRLDHNKFDRLNGLNVRPDTVVGVFDHNEWITTSRRMAIYIYDSVWDGVGDYGDNSWAAPVVWGSDQFLFVEDNTLTADSCVDGYRGTRAVFRFNTFTDCHITGHGTESSGRSRGSRALEIYGNRFVNTLGKNGENIFANIRSGSALIWSNTGIGLVAPARTATLNQDRMIAKFEPYGGADGTSPWDVNGAEVSPFVAASAGKLTVGAAGVAWAAGQWAGYSIRKLICPPKSGQCHSLITGNTADTITFRTSDGFGTADLVFAIGDGFEIRRVLQVLDGIGRGGGPLVAGNPPVQPLPWAQDSFPVYGWNNVNGGVPVGFARHASCVPCVESEHFHNDTPLPGYTHYIYPHPLARLP